MGLMSGRGDTVSVCPGEAPDLAGDKKPLFSCLERWHQVLEGRALRHARREAAGQRRWIERTRAALQLSSRTRVLAWGALGQKPALRTPVSREGSKLDYWTRREWGGLAQGVYTVERKSGGLRGGEE